MFAYYVGDEGVDEILKLYDRPASKNKQLRERRWQEKPPTHPPPRQHPKER